MIKHPDGIYGQSAVNIVETVMPHRAEVRVWGSGTPRIEARSIQQLVMLGLGFGQKIFFEAVGDDAPAVIAALEDLAATGFGMLPDPQKAYSWLRNP